MPKTWTPEEIGKLTRGYQPAAVLFAAVDLEVFDALAAAPLSARQVAAKLCADLRGITILLDALAALEFLGKEGELYHVPSSVADCLTTGGRASVLAMTQHQANCYRRWGQLAATIQAGQPAAVTPSVRGKIADQAAFIEAMNDVSGPLAQQVVADLQPLSFAHLLDVGGASGTWTIEFLRRNPAARATLFDLPAVIPMARKRLAAAKLADRVTLIPGDFYTDQLPPNSADLVWLSAIVHQNSREQNRQLFVNCFAALQPAGRILIRDMVMEESRTRPLAGALFAVNMLSATEAGGTFTLSELAEDLASAGFIDARLIRQEPGMSCVVAAARPR